MGFGSAGELAGLFLSAFLAATLLPGTSEVTLGLVLAQGTSSTAAAVAAATCGNTLGSAVNWALGRFLSQYRDRRWFPLRAERFDRTMAAYRRWGVWSLLLSWVPVIGDPITVVSGVLRTPLGRFLLLVGLAKLARYLAVAGLVQGL